MTNRYVPGLDDIDPVETQEWVDALHSVLEFEGSERANYLLHTLFDDASENRLSLPITTPYLNTSLDDKAKLSEKDQQMLERLTNAMRWNAIAMVMKGGRQAKELGGHLATYGASAFLYEIGFQYFFKGDNGKQKGDLLYIQGHSTPGIYARAYLEGRLNEKQIDYFRQEIFKNGVSSYPHPWLMPDFWQFSTVSMGLGPLMAIYQAQFLKYLDNRGLSDTKNRKVWAFCGDGEMGEPEALGALYLAGREKLDNLIFVISCNLQRLDGPVFGNGQIIQEFEGIFRGAGWNVIKVIWSSQWEELLKKDTQGLLQKSMRELIDGEFQNLRAKGGAYMRENFFGKYPELLELVKDLSDKELESLLDGGHDPQKVYAAYHAAVHHAGQPTVILAKTTKGYGMGAAGEALNICHSSKKMDMESLKVFRERFELPLSDTDLENLNYLKFAENSEEYQYLHDQRKKLGGYLPARHTECKKLKIPALDIFQNQLEGTGDREISTTMSFTRLIGSLLKDENIKEYIVPIMADEARTFGMEGLFRQIGIYSPSGQKYVPEDKHLLMYYREDKKGQLLQQGISEAGGFSSWIAAATSYSSNGIAMIPFFLYYSMMGYQRFGDLVWAAADMRSRGFVMGATAGRTTLAGEGLQHQDGHNILMYGFVPNCVSYDPTFNYELAVIIHHGLKRMYENQEDVFFYITLMNENYTHPAMPKGVEEGILKGMYLLQQSKVKTTKRVQLLGSGTILREVISAAEILEVNYQIASDVWSVTSFNELRKDMDAVIRHNRLHPDKDKKKSYLQQCLEKTTGPVIAATDYIKLYAEQVRAGIEKPYYVLGTDGFGRSDTRAALRDFFEVDAKMIAYTALVALTDQGQFSPADLLKARKQLNIDVDRPDPTTV